MIYERESTRTAPISLNFKSSSQKMACITSSIRILFAEWVRDLLENRGPTDCFGVKRRECWFCGARESRCKLGALAPTHIPFSSLSFCNDDRYRFPFEFACSLSLFLLRPFPFFLCRYRDCAFSHNFFLRTNRVNWWIRISALTGNGISGITIERPNRNANSKCSNTMIINILDSRPGARKEKTSSVVK